MNSAALLLVLLQALATGCAVVLGLWAKMPWPGTLSLALLGASVASAGLAPKGWQRVQSWLLAAAWGCTVGAPASWLLARNCTPDCYYGAMAWLMAAALLAGLFRRAEFALAARWKLLGTTWACLGCLAWLVGAYWQNQAGAFYVGLAASVVLLILCQLCFRMAGWGRQTVTTLLLILIGLPLVDLLLHPAYRLDARPELGAKLYSYQSAKGDPDAFKQWWNCYVEQWSGLGRAIFAPDPSGRLPFRMRPSSQGFLFESKITINSLGFRGREISRDKGQAYRIVALGESTTFGCTLRAGDKPWPELLEQMIAERLHPQRPVEVVNVGVPSYDLVHNLYRLRTEILPLQPDLIISYHGANGFRFLDAALPSLCGNIPPVYRPRPLKLLANCEFRLRVLYCRRLQTPRPYFHRPTLSDTMDSAYAKAYRELIQICHTNQIRLVLANYCMAVNAQSDTRIADFYSSTYPSVARMVQANQFHSQMLRNLGLEHPEVALVDTQPGLDGAEDKFIDLLHFTQEGRQHIAESMFAGIKHTLEQDIAQPP
jgi:lysophospholipase L1-like esterase